MIPLWLGKRKVIVCGEYLGVMRCHFGNLLSSTQKKVLCNLYNFSIKSVIAFKLKTFWQIENGKSDAMLLETRL